MKKSQYSRRHFLKNQCASMGATTLLSSSLQLLSSQVLAADTQRNDYKALVCVLLAGGNDSFNMVVPLESGSYNDYRTTRSDLALPQQALLPISPQGEVNNSYGFHPAMTAMQSLFEQQQLAVMANVGTLSQPLTRAEEATQARVPLGLYSHSDQITQWQTALSDRRSATGWAGRMADLLQSSQQTPLPMNISVGESNIFQTGTQVGEYSIAPGFGAQNIEGYTGENEIFTGQKSAIDQLLAQTYQHVFRRAIANKTKQYIETNQIFNSAIQQASPLTTRFSTSEFSQSLKMIADTIAVRSVLNANRQTFFVVLGGWDHHDELLNNQQRLLTILSQGLSEFQQAINEQGLGQQVTTFTISDFGRTLTSNGRGSDHGWGGNQLVMGGAVNGGRFYGQYPSLASGNSLDTGRGRLVPTTSSDVFFAELALWFGVSPNDLSMILPNLQRFYSLSSNAKPLGFMV
ncbi:MAG: DUF1501 domain-containing protein [Pseudomonadota bacterium]